MANVHRIVVILSAFLICASNPSRSLSAADKVIHPIEGRNSSAQYKIRSGNSVKITVYEEPDLTLETTVGDDGYITYPLLGRIKVSDLTKSELEEHLIKKLQDGYIINPQVMVAVVNYSNFFIYGEVSKPGEYKMDGSLNILEAIAMAGGFSRVAAPNSTRVIREKNGKKETFFVEVGSMSKNKSEKTFVLEPGDVVFVPESFF